ncbi:Ankyrin repeat family protein [Mycena indigotica]|uniref:Ankyrin repeat family protein n=1 Tax=Mycena indigotica TaxID=2126181 RepID=A0A8H6RX09_9AGAR|nr:Ankyrin repeat family protein [Mycena indigotica]KAF7289340.1 Ankyrin repeat family protein [Mycena indigotica]
MRSLDKNELQIHVKSKRHIESPRHIKVFKVTATHGNEVIASLKIWKIVRTEFRDDFLVTLYEELFELSELFDKYGRVRPRIIEPGYHSGTMCWGEELNKGDLFYIFSVSVKEELHVNGQGIGSWLLNKFLRSQRIQQEDIVICWPTYNDIDDPVEETGDRQVAFFRKNHFRRIGRTRFFGYSRNNRHVSRLLSIEEDVEELGAGFKEAPTDPQREYPLRHAIRCDKTSRIVDTIQEYYDRDPSSIHAFDWAGFTPLHTAADNVNLFALRKLLSWDMSADLVNITNASGETPLGALQLQMNCDRTDVDTQLVYNWEGYPEDELEAEFLLKQRMGIPVPSTLGEYIQKSRYGCTCGQCTGGWLSPRMRFQLSCKAAYAMDTMPEFYDEFTQGKPGDLTQLYYLHSDYIPPTFQSNFYLSFYEGYCNVFRAIYELLESTDEILSVETVERRLPGTSYYLRKGGRIEFVLDAITNTAYEASALRDNEHEEIFGEDEGWTALPTCANDLDFQLVRTVLGLIPGKRWGPYQLISYR